MDVAAGEDSDGSEECSESDVSEPSREDYDSDERYYSEESVSEDMDVDSDV
ncbi:hypothetical protein PI124_g21513 [Phytophthora idaei]|nr:hypothetical protein PI125_g23195 [Phytophthora idaei]KAG3131677.1 hypothetical protein PI126_g19960 [Phytophthora idaei]KAG3233410.1 hypothetical protein PI124_g21513 [Phytophthora idaei]